LADFEPGTRIFYETRALKIILLKTAIDLPKTTRSHLTITFKVNILISSSKKSKTFSLISFLLFNVIFSRIKTDRTRARTATAPATR
jgi:hypothetical protein